MTETRAISPGWYDDGHGSQRYWDGTAWTENTHQAAATTVVSEQAAPTPSPSGAPKARSSKIGVVGIIALIVAVIGFVFACMPGALIVGWILLPTAFVLSLVALFLPGRKWPALVGLVVSIVGTVVGFVVFFSVMSSSVDEAFGSGDTTVSVPGETPVQEAPSEVPSEAAAQGGRENPVPIGSVVSGDDYDVTINSVTINATEQVLAANQFNEAPDAGFVYALVNATITYTGEESGFASFVGIDFVTATGEVLTSTDSFAVAPEPTLGLDELYNGGTVTGNIVIAVPEDGSGVIRVRPGVIADEVFVAVQ